MFAILCMWVKCIIQVQCWNYKVVSTHIGSSGAVHLTSHLSDTLLPSGSSPEHQHVHVGSFQHWMGLKLPLQSQAAFHWPGNCISCPQQGVGGGVGPVCVCVGNVQTKYVLLWIYCPPQKANAIQAHAFSTPCVYSSHASHNTAEVTPLHVFTIPQVLLDEYMKYTQSSVG